MTLSFRKNDVIKAATEDWKSKWTPAILAYVETLKSKAIETALRVLESKFRGKQFLITFSAYVQLIYSVLLTIVQMMKRMMRRILCISWLHSCSEVTQKKTSAWCMKSIRSGRQVIIMVTLNNYYCIIFQIADNPSVAGGGKTSAPIIGTWMVQMSIS